MTRAYLHIEPAPTGPAGPPRRASATAALIDQHLAGCVSAGDEVHVLLELCGAGSLRDLSAAVGERLLAVLGSTEFEDEVRFGPDMAGIRLRRLAALRVRINASAMADDRRAHAAAILRRIDAMIHADAAQAANDIRPRRALSPGPASGSEQR